MLPVLPPSGPLPDHPGGRAFLSRDPVLGGVIVTLGPLAPLTPTPDPFGTLVRSVIGQQLSVAAAGRIAGRVGAALGEVTPGTLEAAAPDRLRALGLSWAKVRTVQALAAAALDSRVDFAHLSTLPDEAVVAALTPLPGIGRWTAEMFLMFGLARPDVFSHGDLILRQGLARLAPGTDPHAVAAAWSPHRTLAARALWADHHARQVRGRRSPAPQ
ncbi:DNA-3-methyladenine glycosylase 2 family protein [Deinococcus sp. MIMF12]|uniref:DNA-3-methyladenine glycosylase II n=1 Tax=Deinococcus rhizophilus TaxID=3049544 RepID=A0ABT7JJ15_9DEIO|nr:DNA-3-methyladenine glycosylase 2 family protein [Deinococcus rhizophilus]MDL2344582.1 DNA-3-methyladenine glycosylase 2 family protein [Deinococcus rhizophilus]